MMTGAYLATKVLSMHGGDRDLPLTKSIKVLLAACITICNTHSYIKGARLLLIFIRRSVLVNIIMRL